MTADPPHGPPDPPSAGDPGAAAERAQWARARQVREQHDADARREAESRAAERPAEPTPPSSTSQRLAVVAVIVAVLFLGAVAVLLVTIRHRSNQQPAWVAQLGLDSQTTADGPAPARLGSARGGREQHDGARPRAVDPSPTSSVASAPTDDAPVIDTTGEDFDRIYHQIEELESWLLVHPDPTRVAEIYQPGSSPYNDLVGQLSDLKTAGQALQVQDYRILGVTVDSRPAPDRVELRYADTYSDAVTTSATTGAVVGRAPYDGRSRLWTLTLQRGDDGHWRVAATAFVQYGGVPAS